MKTKMKSSFFKDSKSTTWSWLPVSPFSKYYRIKIRYPKAWRTRAVLASTFFIEFWARVALAECITWPTKVSRKTLPWRSSTSPLSSKKVWVKTFSLRRICWWLRARFLSTCITVSRIAKRYTLSWTWWREETCLHIWKDRRDSQSNKHDFSSAESCLVWMSCRRETWYWETLSQRTYCWMIRPILVWVTLVWPRFWMSKTLLIPFAEQKSICRQKECCDEAMIDRVIFGH